MIHEAIKIRKHQNFNTEDGWHVSPGWNSLINYLRLKLRLMICCKNNNASEIVRIPFSCK